MNSLIKKTKKQFREINIGIFFFSILFGISGWVVFSGIWVETPLLLQKLPEGWKIPSMIGAVSQFAQIGPILLFLMKCKCISCFKGNFSNKLRQKEVPDRIIIYALFISGLSAGSMVAIFWDKTFYVFGAERSVAFFICVFFLAILDCTCTIVFLTYVGNFKGNYITGLYIGEGISSLLPSFFALLQGIGEEEIKCVTNITQSIKSPPIKEPRFSISVYFWLLFSTLVISFIAFLFLDFWPSFQIEKIDYCKNKHKKIKNDYEKVETNQFNDIETENLNEKKKKIQQKEPKKQESTLDKFLLLTAMAFVAFTLYGFIPGLSSYSSLPYGSNIMHLSVTLALITQPISSFIATFFQIKSTRNIWILLVISMFISGYIFVASYLSPCPPFKNNWIGGYLMIFCWILIFALLMFLRCCITSSLKRRHGQSSLVWCGLITQFGQFIGGIMIYLLVDIFALFKEADSCKEYIC